MNRSKIEAMIGRDLERERRVGVVHFVAGQLDAVRLEEAGHEVVQISWVDALGNAWLMIVVKIAGEWEPAVAFRGGQTFMSEVELPALSVRMVEAAEAAA